MAGKELKGREKVVSKMTRDGLTEENLADGSVKDISHRSRGRPSEMKQDFVFDREKKKAELPDGQGGEGNLRRKQIRESSLRKEVVSGESTLEENVLGGEGDGEKNISGEFPKDKKKFREHAQIPEEDSLFGQKKKIRKKQLQKQMTNEQKKSGRLSFDDEENQMIKGPGMKLGRTIGRYAVRDAISKVVSDPEEEDQDVSTETVRFAERGTETAVRGLRYAQLRSQRADVKVNRRGYHLDETEEKLKFGMSDSMGKAGAEETAKKSKEKKRVLNRFFQRKRYKDAYRAARTGKSAGSAGGAATIAGVENITVKAKIALKEIVKRNRAVFFGAGIFVFLFLIVAVSLGSCSASIQGGGSVIEITTYPGTDEDIYAAENYYASLETALNEQINGMETTHPDYDEYQYNVSEIAHNPYHLISYLTAKYGDWKFEDIKDELQALFEAQYHLNTEGKTESAVHHNEMEEKKLLEYAALAECASSHPISKSLQKAYGKEIDRSRVSDIQEVSGHGIIAKVDGHEVAAGNSKLMKKIGVKYYDCHRVGTIIHMAIDGAYAGHIVISDILKPHSKEVIAELKKAGVEKTVMLTGDAKRVADQVAASLGIDEVYSELLPGDKVSKVEELLAMKSEKDKLAFVGDGINDAPVLTRADIGIAMGAMGSDAAIEAADVVLMDDDPLKISKAIKISRKCLRIVYQNIVFALIIKFACLGLGAIGIANMWFAIFADVGVMIIAILNAIRALRVHKL